MNMNWFIGLNLPHMLYRIEDMHIPMEKVNLNFVFILKLKP